MTQHPPHDWSRLIKQLEDRLEQSEIRQRETIENLRQELAGLKKLLAQQEAPSPEEAYPTSPSPVPEIPPPSVGTIFDFESPPAPAPEPIPPPLPPVFFSPDPPTLPSETPPAFRESMEMDFGRVWLVRIGIVLLLIGLVYGANYAYQNWVRELPAALRLTALYLCSTLIGGAGAWLARKEKTKNYGEVLLAGGLAFFYYCTYAAHQVKRLQVIESPVTAALLLLGAAALIAAISWFRQSRTTAVMGILLASFSTLLQPLDWLSAASNVILSAMGILLMLRPKWGAPGFASLLGTYGAFAGWQVLGAAGGQSGNSEATLWFLPATWAVFAVPATFGFFRQSLSQRARLWYGGLNNGCFILLFCLVWADVYGTNDLWRVVASFGVLLLLIGSVLKRRQDSISATHLSQGLLCLTAALVMKVEGYSLVVGLAMECFALALAFYRFRTRVEYVFSMLAGVCTPFLALGLHLDATSKGAPLGHADSLLIAAAFLAAASVIFRLNASRSVNPPSSELRSSTSLLVFSTLGTLVLGGCRLPVEWQLPAFAGTAALFACISAFLDRKRWLPEIAVASCVCGIFALLCLRQPTSTPGLWIALIVATIACIIWDRDLPTSPSESTPDLFRHPRWPAWLFAVLAPAIAFLVSQQQPGNIARTTGLALCILLLVATARFLKSSKLQCTAIALNLALLANALFDPSANPWVVLAPSAVALISLFLLEWGRPGKLPQATLNRWIFTFAWMVAWMRLYPDDFVDAMAASAGVAFLVAHLRKQPGPVAGWVWTGVSMLSMYWSWMLERLGDPAYHALNGIVLVLLLIGLALRPPRFENASLQASAAKILPWLACFVLTFWSTNVVVASYGWQGVTLLWSILGFALVTFGLLVNRVTSRKAGFILLGLALGKLFLSDVWAFGSLMRVVSFIALGLALVLLGLFYHRFAPALKRILKDQPPLDP